MKQGIKHIEFWVSDLKRSDEFYSGLLGILGWERVGIGSFKLGDTKIYMKESGKARGDVLGPRHVCFWAESREIVDKAGEFLKGTHAEIIRGPMEVRGGMYSPGYYTVDFRDTDGYILEVAHTP